MNRPGSNPFDFHGRVVLITGGTSGIGYATVDAFARAGAVVVYTGRRDELGEQQANAFRAEGLQVEFFKGDVTDESGLAQLVKTIVERHGRLDIAVNNAGIESEPTALEETATADYQTILDINVNGVFFAMKAQIPAMRASGGGSIINTSSVFGVAAMAHLGPYVASKHAVIGLTKTAALEVAHENIRVNTVFPGGLNTDMMARSIGDSEEAMTGINALHPMGRVGHPLEIANAILWLASEASSFVTGQSICVDGGYTAK